MPDEIELLQRSSIFCGIAAEDIQKLCTCMACRRGVFGKNEVILLQGSRVTTAGILLRGSIRAESTDPDGERSIQSRLHKGEVFADALTASQTRESPVSIIAEEETEVLFVPFDGLMQPCAQNCSAHRQVQLNLLREIAEKFWALQRRVAYLSMRSLRGRIVEYLSDAMEQSHSRTVYIPFTRDEWAAVLGVNRSALSRELGRMQKEGLLLFYRNSFRIPDPQKLYAARRKAEE